MRGSIDNQSRQIFKLIDGTHTSKFKARNKSEISYLESSKKISPFIHSFKYKNDVLNTIKDLGNFARRYHDIKDMQQITDKIIIHFFHAKIENECTYDTISNYISHIRKALISLSKMKKNTEKHNKLFTEESLIISRKFAKTLAIKNEKINRAYKNPEKIISLLPKTYSLIAKLQLYYGLRVLEASKIKLSQLDYKKNEFTFQGKGGYTLTKHLDNYIFNALDKSIKESVKNNQDGFLIKYDDYVKELKKAVEICSEIWNGSHGFRYCFAQKEFQIYIDSGMNKDEAFSKVSHNMGHHRSEITGTYIGR